MLFNCKSTVEVKVSNTSVNVLSFMLKVGGLYRVETSLRRSILVYVSIEDLSMCISSTVFSNKLRKSTVLELDSIEDIKDESGWS